MFLVRFIKRLLHKGEPMSRKQTTAYRGLKVLASTKPDLQRQISSKGGRTAHELGVAHEWDTDEAKMAGQKGGNVTSRDRAHMSAIGSLGGKESGRRRHEKALARQANKESANNGTQD